MRILFQTPPIPNSSLRRPDGTLQLGSASFVVRVFEADEKVPPGYFPSPVREWRKELAASGGLRAPTPDAVQFPAGAAPVGLEVPKALLDALTDDQQISIEWAVGGTHV